ncbi:MAG: hypothetical protein GX822_10685 [Alcaligenaceae bacterium]|nr:hypothetical protein [Alcaligenaceae bacterium]
MKRFIKPILLALLSCQLPIAWAQTEESFPNFTWITPNLEYESSRFGFEPASFTLVNQDCRKVAKEHPCYEDLEWTENILLGTYQNASMAKPLYVIYSPGPSVDPLFTIIDQNNQRLWSEGAEQMAINSNGVIYLSGNTNKMFNQRMKFQLSNYQVQEVPQPYYYVDVRGALLKPVKLYSQPNNQGQLIATLPVGYDIEILLAAASPQTTSDTEFPLTKDYLARTAFGLVGWLRLTDDDTFHMNPIVPGLGFMGD